METEQENYPLTQIYFYLTEGCNLACRHCWLAPKYDPTGRHFQYLPADLFQTIISEAKPLGLQTVKLTGGEPLLHPDFKKLLNIIRLENIHLAIETNGILCTPDIAQEIAKSPIRFVSVSLDGAKADTHEWVRGVKGSFSAACAAVKNLVEAGIKPQIIFSIMHHNSREISNIISLAEDLGASSVKFNIVQSSGRGERLHNEGEILGIKELVELGHYIENELAHNTSLPLRFSYPKAFQSLSRIAKSDGCGSCGIKGLLGVIPSGHYALCGIGEHIPDLVYGMAGSDRLEDIWRNNSKINHLRYELPDHLEGICSRCLMRDTCLGYCPAQNYYHFGSLLKPFWFCKEAEEQGIFPSSRKIN